MKQCLLKMTRHVDGIDKDDHAAMDALIATIRDDTKEDFKSYVDMLLFKASGNDKVWKRVSDGADYILNNWTAAKYVWHTKIRCVAVALKVISAAKVIASEHLDVPDWAGYYERMQATISNGIKKSVSLAI